MSFAMLYLEKLNSQINFAYSHNDLDPICGPIDNFAENLRSVEDYLDRTSIPTTTCGTGTAVTSFAIDRTSTPTSTCGTSTAVTSFATVNTIVDKCHIVTVSNALQTEFLDQQQSDDQQPDESARYRRPEYQKLLLTRSFLESIGLDIAYLPATSDSHVVYII
jgi:hypothetical protein